MTEAATQALPRAQQPAGPPTPIAWLMGLTTCVLTTGFIYWGVQLAQRDPMSLPVIRAPEGLARLEPTQPGGLQSEFQGLAVNQLQSGEAGDEDQVIALAPAPMGLSEEDIPALIDLEADALEPVQVEIAEIDGAEIVPAPEDGSDVAALDDSEIMMPVTAEEVEAALAEALKLAEEAVQSSQPETETAAVDEEEIDIASLIVADVKSNLISTTEVEEAEGTTAEASDAVEAEVAEDATEMAAEEATVAEVEETDVAEIAATAEETETAETDAVEIVLEAAQPTSSSEKALGEIDVASVDVGTRLIQLGAFGSREIALDMWQTLQNRNTDLLGGRSYFIQPVESGGKTLFRLRVLGFETTADARSMCAALTDRKTPCIAVIQR